MLFAVTGIVAAAILMLIWRFNTATRSGDSPALPSIPFTDVTAQAGINFVPFYGTSEEKLLPETMGGGCAFFDYDNDSKPDILFVNPLPPSAAHGQVPSVVLYHNDGGGHFTDVTAGSGLDSGIYGMGVAVGDFDNDGLDDVFITGIGGNHLFRNLGGGKFQDVTERAGVGGEGGWSTSAAFVDVDNDGRLDLFVCNYVQWNRKIDIDQGFSIPDVGRAYGPPLAFAGTCCQLFHNNGDGTFTDISARAGIRVIDSHDRPAGKSLAVAPVDLDGDGWIDLVVANDTTPNFVFHNKGDGTFEEIGSRTGLAVGSAGAARGAMGIDAAYFRNDSTLGIAVGNFAEELNALYVSDDSSGPISFHDDATAAGVGPATRHVLTFGLFFFDADLDGRLDLLMANGHIEPSIDRLQTPQHYKQPAILLWNRGGTRRPDLVPLTARQCGQALFEPIVARGAAYADIDGDGDLDLLLTQCGQRPLLLRNDQKSGHHWLRLKLIGDPARHVNRDAIGAWIEATAGGQTLRRQVMPTRSYLSQVELPVTLGLGDSTHVDRLTILWPNRSRQEVPITSIDRTVTIRQTPEPGDRH